MLVRELAKFILRRQELSKVFKHALAENTKLLQEKYRQEQEFVCSSKKEAFEILIVQWRF